MIITYLIYSTVSLTVLLLLYHLLLEKEKMHKVNRGFLIFSLIFSLTIPLIPVGVDSLNVNLSSLFVQESIEASAPLAIDGHWLEDEAGLAAAADVSTKADYTTLLQSLLLLYILIAFGLFVRLLRIIYIIQLKADRNEKRLHGGVEVVLLNEEEIPHTFLNTIFLNRGKYLKGEIPQEVMIHELTHVRQLHTLDVLLIELLKIVFWFNPIFYLYKKAILLNHEFLADDAVISHGTEVKNYQSMLLNSLLKTPAYSLVNSLNFSLTKKRLQMMTQPKSTYRSALKLAALIPFVIIITMLPGCESTSTELTDEPKITDVITIEIKEGDVLLVDREVMTLDELDSYFSSLSEPPEIVSLRVRHGVTFGTITDVQTLLRKHEALRINYAKSDVGSDVLKKVTKEYQRAVAAYMAVDANHTNYEELKERYEEVSELMKSIQGVELELPQLTPPPPPMPPRPELRMMNDTSSAVNNASPPPPIKARNMMRILMNTQGMLLMNEELATLGDVREKIKTFVNNRGEDPNLSVSPADAVISIKTAQNTPYDLYIELIEEVTGAFSEMRDEAAYSQFGASFSSFESDSDEREVVREKYPMKISIIPPDQN